MLFAYLVIQPSVLCIKLLASDIGQAREHLPEVKYHRVSNLACWSYATVLTLNMKLLK